MTHHWLSDAIRFEILMALIDTDPFFGLGIRSFWLATCASLFYVFLTDVEAGIEHVCPRSGPHYTTWCEVLCLCLSYSFFKVWSCSGNSIWMTHHWLSDAIRFGILMAHIDKHPFLRLGIRSFWLATCASLFYVFLPDVEAGTEDVHLRSGPHYTTWCEGLCLCLSYSFF